jgi:hypothetical protein
LGRAEVEKNCTLQKILYNSDADLYSLSFEFSNGERSPPPGIYFGDAKKEVMLPKNRRISQIDFGLYGMLKTGFWVT